MDKFTKYALSAMAITVAVMLVGTYVGAVVLKGGMEGTDATVIPQSSTSLSLFSALGPAGEYVGFSVAGAVGGLLVGYILPTITEQTAPQAKRENHV